MKKVIASRFSLLVLVMVACTSLFGQAPQSFNYQAVVRDVAGTILPNQLVAFRMNIHEGSASGTTVYSETHMPTTNAFGFIAQELYQVLPTAVVVGGEDAKTEPWMVDCGLLTPLLVKSTQEQQDLIEAQSILL